MVIIEDSKNTKRFKYWLLSELVKAVDNWRNTNKPLHLSNVILFDGKEHLPDFKKSGKIDKEDYHNSLLKYIQNYLGDKFDVNFPYIIGNFLGDKFDVNFSDISEDAYSNLEIQTKEPPSKYPLWWVGIKAGIFILAANLLDELVEKPYSEAKEKEVVLRELGKEYDINPLDRNKIRAQDFSNEEIKHVRFFKTLQDLEEEGLIQIYGEPEGTPGFSISRSLIRTLSRGWEVEFETTEKFIKIWEKKKKEEKKKKKLESKNNEEEIIKLFLNRDGDLYREPKKGHCYDMRKDEGRHNIVKYFAKNKIYSYRNTFKIAKALNKNEKTLMGEIGKINSEIEQRVKIRNKLLESKTGSGYRINPKYKIVLVR